MFKARHPGFGATEDAVTSDKTLRRFSFLSGNIQFVPSGCTVVTEPVITVLQRNATIGTSLWIVTASTAFQSCEGDTEHVQHSGTTEFAEMSIVLNGHHAVLL